MALSYDVVSIRNAMLDTITTRAGNGALLRIYDGTRPATGAAITTQTLLAELTCGTPFAAGAASGVLTLGAITQDASANNTGTASWFRIWKADGLTFVLDGTVTATGGGGDLLLTTVSIVATQPVSVTSFVITEANP
jgi:hypothetical protein